MAAAETAESVTIGRTPQLDRRVLVMSFPQIAISAGGLAVLVLVLVVEGAGLLRRVRRCPVDEKRQWKAAIGALKRATTQRRKRGATGGVIVGKEPDVENEWKTVRDAGRAVRTAVMKQVDKLSESARNRIDGWVDGLRVFRNRLAGATMSVVEQRGVMATASSLLFMVLASIHILYYSYFDFNVLEYLPGYSLPAIMLSLLQVLVLLLLVSLFLVFAVAFVSPWAVLQLARICYGIHAAVAKALANSFFTLCHYSMTCGRLASLLLDDRPAASAREPAPTTTSVVSAVSRTIRRLSPRRRKTGGAEADSRGRIADPAMSLFLLFLFACACAVFIWFEPQYRAHATCRGARSTKVVIDPPLGDDAVFTKIGQIGEHVFLVPSGECGRRANQAPRDGGTDGVEALDGYRYVLDSIRDRLRFLQDGVILDRLDESIDVTVVPVNRVLCMYENNGDRSGNSACGPRLQTDEGAGIPILYYRRTDNTWVMVVPPEVRIQMDYEWRVKDEIARRLCNGGEAVVSEPVVFERGESTPAHAQRAQETIEAFLNKPELQGVKLHALGFASGDGSRRYNKELATRRAETVVAKVRKLDDDRTPEPKSWGENHLTNGVASSRSVRLVGCRPVADAAANASGQRANTAAER